MSERSYNASNVGNSASRCPHNYPVTITTPGFASAIGLAKRTLPFAWYRYVEWLFLTAIMTVVLTVVVGLCLVSYMYIHPYAGGAVLIACGLALVFWVMPFIEHQAFLSHCGHIAVLTNLIMKGEVGNGSEKMFRFGRSLVVEKLGELDTIRNVYTTIRAATRQLVRTLDFIDNVLPESWGIDLGFVKRGVCRVVNWAMPYIDAVVLSYGMARGDQEFGTAGLDGLVYSIQNAGSVIKTAIGAWFLEKVILGPLWLLCALAFGVGAAYGVLQFTNADVVLLQQDPHAFFTTFPFIGLGAVAAGFVIGPLLAHMITKTFSEAFVRPMLIAMVLIKFHVVIRNQPLDAKLQSRIVEGGEGLANISEVAGKLNHVVA